MKRFSVTIPLIVGIILLMETLDTTVINSSIPTMATTLGSSPLSLRFAINSYLLSLAIFMPISGYLADQFGCKRTLIVSILIFLIGSLCCAFSHSLTTLVLGRVIQGLGGALSVPTARLVLIRNIEKSDYVRAFSYSTILCQVGPAIGPFIGGLITTTLGWQFIFWLNIPIGISAVVLLGSLIKTKEEKIVNPFNLREFVLFSCGLALFFISINMYTEPGISVWVKFPMLMASILLFSLYFIRPSSMFSVFDLKLFSVRTFRLSMFGSSITRICVSSFPFVFPLLFQVCFGLSPLESGLLVMPFGLGTLSAKALVHRVLAYIGYRRFLIINPFIVAALFVLLAFVVSYQNMSLLIIITFLLGLMLSLQFTYVNSLSYFDITEQNKSRATSMTSILQQVTVSLSVCISTQLLALFTPFAIHNFIPLYAFQWTWICLAILLIPVSFIYRGLKQEDALTPVGVKNG